MITNNIDFGNTKRIIDERIKRLEKDVLIIDLQEDCEIIHKQGEGFYMIFKLFVGFGRN